MKSFSKSARIAAIALLFLCACPAIADDSSLNSRSVVITTACTNAGNAAAQPYVARVAGAVRSGDRGAAENAGCMAVREGVLACLAAMEAVSPTSPAANMMARGLMPACN